MNGRFIPVAVMKYDAWWTRRYGREYNPTLVGNAYDNSYVILVRDIPIAHFDTMEEAETASEVAKKAISMVGGVSPSDEDHPLAQKEMDGYTEKNIRGGINRAEGVSATDWANYEGDLPEQYPHRRPRKSGRGSRPILGPDRKAYGEEKRRRLKARSPTLTVTKVEPDDKIPTFNRITFENGLVAGYPKTKNAKVGDKFVVSSQEGGRFPSIMDAESYNAEVNSVMVSGSVEGEPAIFNYSKGITDDFGFTPGRIATGENTEELFAQYPLPDIPHHRNVKGFKNYKNNVWKKHMGAEGNAPIQDPMEFGEMANWTPLDGSEGLKRKRAEAIKVESVAAQEDIRMIYVRTREAAEEEAEKFIRHYFPADMKYAYQINATDEPNRWEMLYGQIPQGMESTFTDDYYDAESPSATIPVKGSEPSWAKPVATALGFALGFFGIHEIKKVL